MSDGFASIDIILFAMLAAYLVFQLRRVLGRRTGNERRVDPFAAPEDAEKNARGESAADNVVPLPDRTQQGIEDGSFEEEEEPETLAAGLMRLKRADPSFDEKEFTRGAKAAFEYIVGAFADGDTDRLRPLLSPALFGGFASEIQRRDDAGETLETTVSSVRAADVIEARLNGAMAEVTVEFTSDQVKVARDAEGEVIDGEPDKIETITDIWTFSRDTRTDDPNWQLVATRVPEE